MPGFGKNKSKMLKAIKKEVGKRVFREQDKFIDYLNEFEKDQEYSA